MLVGLSKYDNLIPLAQFGRDAPADGDSLEQTKDLAAKMGNLTILRKGSIDVISDGNNCNYCVTSTVCFLLHI